MPRSYAAYQPQYLFGGPYAGNSHLDNHMHGSMSTMGFPSSFMGDFRQLNPMAAVGMNPMQDQSLRSMPSLASVADMGTTRNENDNHFNI